MARRFLIVAVMLSIATTVSSASTIPDPVVDSQRNPGRGQRTAVLGGGCFWGLQAVFEHVKGVTAVTAGYSGGSAGTANYETVSEGSTGHAEAVRITYDPSRITYGQLLKVFFSVAHDPTEINRQGPDTGRQYRSVIFYANEEQRRIAQAYINQLDQAKVFERPIVTQVAGLHGFYNAESYHQDFAISHPDDPYIVVNDLPKVANLRKEMPNLYAPRRSMRTAVR
ncbi:MAG TPA: peptide-methionine (S)-S-oxide reductase MsrA [Pyrinomonadaceae bacterium]|jgi:peptide-methionine (S)-S-oxide reductase|nr:peptide-methionine (S)-S-oxide reductase MsrA [Pyrinomonadaceae bacterium]